jgi:hypothetical protein
MITPRLASVSPNVAMIESLPPRLYSTRLARCETVPLNGSGSGWRRSLTVFGMTNPLIVIPSGREESFLMPKYYAILTEPLATRLTPIFIHGWFMPSNSRGARNGCQF